MTNESAISHNEPSKPTKPRPAGTVKLWQFWLFVPTLMIVGGVGGGLVVALVGGGLAKTNTEIVRSVVESEGEVIAEAAEKISPSVVSIVTEQKTTYRNYFYGSQDYTTQAAGTGVIISADGLIITNKHVIPDGTTKVTVVLLDGTEYDDVTVVDRDPTNDIAFLKIKDAKDLPAAEIGDSSKIKIGTKVIAVGNALGQFQNSVTSGIISGLDRSITATDESGGGSEALTGLLQTDAAINSGNSGGPLITFDGKVIGINTAIANDANNIGFAIPSDTFIGTIDSVKKKGKIEKAYLGVYYTTITKAIAKEKNLAVDHGAMIGADNQKPTVAGSPADQAGLKSGDIITKIDDTTLDEHSTLSSVIGKKKVGDTVTLTILRDGREITVKVTLAAYQE